MTTNSAPRDPNQSRGGAAEQWAVIARNATALVDAIALAPDIDSTHRSDIYLAAMQLSDKVQALTADHPGPDASPNPLEQDALPLDPTAPTD